MANLTTRGNGIIPWSGAGGNIVVDPINAAIADGRYFTGGHMFLGVPDRSAVQFLLKVPLNHKDTVPDDEERGAVCFRAIAEEKARLTLQYGVAVATDGTKVNLYNQNLNDAKKFSNVEVFHTPTGVTGARELITNKPINGGKIHESGFMVLVPDINYLFTIFNVSGIPADLYLEVSELEYIYP